MDIDQFLSSHDGVVSRDQARACGLSDDQISRRLTSGTWLRRAPAVYFAVAWVWTAAARVRVAAEWAGPKGGALVGIAAAWWCQLGVDSPHPLAVALPCGNAHPPPGITALRRDLRADRVRRRGLWVTSKALTVLDAAVALGRDGQPFLDRALQRHVNLDDLRAVQSRHLARRGSAAAGRLIARAGDRAASETERRMIALLKAAGITGWSINLPVALTDGRTAIADVAFPALRFAIEVDGWAHHEDPASFVGDRARKRALVANGWTVVEVTWWDLEHNAAQVVADLRAALAHLGAR